MSSARKTFYLETFGCQMNVVMTPRKDQPQRRPTRHAGLHICHSQKGYHAGGTLVHESRCKPT
jgi:hypothetical protein